MGYHMALRLLCFDIGFRNMGWSLFEGAVLASCGVIRTSKDSTVSVAGDHSRCSVILSRGLGELIDAYDPIGIMGEMPVGGAKSSRALALMMSANSIISSVADSKGIPTEWCTPSEVKIAVTGNPNAKKPEIMSKVAAYYPQVKVAKRIKPRGKRVELVYSAFGQNFTEDLWEHIADSCGVFWALRDSDLGRLATGQIGG